MTKNICPTCQTEKLFISAWRESYTVMILLRCQCKDWPVRVENSRFNKGDYEMFKLVSAGGEVARHSTLDDARKDQRAIFDSFGVETSIEESFTDVHLSQKSNEAIENLITKFPQYIEAAINDPHTGLCRCERCYVITFEQEEK